MPRILVYTTSQCPYCQKAKNLLTRKSLPFQEIDLTNNPQGRRDLVTKVKGQKTVPQIFINDSHIGGYEDLERLEKEGKIFF